MSSHVRPTTVTALTAVPLGLGVLALAAFIEGLHALKTVTLRALRRDAAVLDRAAAGQEIVVTRRGKPYVRISPATEARSFLGAGRHLAQRRAVSPDPVPAREWKGMV